MKLNTSLTNKQPKQTFSAAVTGSALQNLIRKSVPDAASAARLTGTLISAVASNQQLQQCNAASVVAAALRGEGQGLILGREYHLIPFGDMCAYVIGFRGLMALALSTGDVADMDCIEVRDGEFVGRDPRTKRPKFDFSVYATDEESEQHPVIGYYAYVEKMDGFFRAEYMRVGEILNHAERYSKTFDRAKYDAVYNGLGDYTPKDIEKIKASSPWYGNFDAMAKKTVLRKLLNSGFVRLANSAVLKEALSADAASEDGLIPNLDLGGADAFAGEYVESTAVVSDADIAPVSDEASEPKKNTRGTKSSDNGEKNAVSVDSGADYENTFFGG